MRLLLDTHVLLWWSAGQAMSKAASEAIAAPENDVAISVASLWETEIKVQAGKLRLADDLYARLREQRFEEVPIRRPHALAAARLPPHHADPFDRVMMAQALVEGMVLVTRDSMFERYDVPLLQA